MYKCKYCSKEVKSESGLKRHMDFCKVKNDLEEENKMLKSSVLAKEIFEESKENIVVKDEPTDSSKAIEKLFDLRKSTFDAETRNRIDLQIKELNSES
jgi:hypothetical protein